MSAVVAVVLVCHIRVGHLHALLMVAVVLAVVVVVLPVGVTLVLGCQLEAKMAVVVSLVSYVMHNPFRAPSRPVQVPSYRVPL